MSRSLIWTFLALLFLSSCKKNDPGPSGPPPEEPYCDREITHSDPILVTGISSFNIRQSTSTGLKSEVNGGPIPFAEIRVLNVRGDTVQCSQTYEDGRFAFYVPRNQEFRLRINSRSNSIRYKASVLDSPNTNAYYYYEFTFSTYSSAASVEIGPIIASAKAPPILGGAFNILYNFYRANDALRFGICGGATTSCASFDLAPKVTAYWKAGVDPHSSYFGGSTNLSFYIPGTYKLYILGGVNGDVNSSDTDHFDDSVISHEYGHFLEDTFGKSESPGGLHDGNHVIDARLAWSEGWGYFFATYATASKIIRDTYGNEDGTTGVYINYDVEKNNSALDPSSGSMSAGEGNFREFAVNRFLLDVIDPFQTSATGSSVGANGGAGDDDGSDSYTEPFSTIWTTFRGTWTSSSVYFRSLGKFLSSGTFSGAAYTNAKTFHSVRGDVVDYAQPLPTTTSVCAATTIRASDVASCDIAGTTICTRGDRHQCCSNQLKSNDFYLVTYDGSFTNVSISRTSGTGDLDLFLYKPGYTFGKSADIATSSEGTGATESVSFSNLPKGTYLLNVNQYTGSGNPIADTTYKIYVDGAQVCP